MTVGSPPACCHDRSTTIFWLRLAALATWVAALIFLSLLPGVTAPTAVLSWDKFNHFAAYFVLTVLSARFLLGWRSAPAHAWLIAACCAFVLGGLLELLQGMMEVGRHAEWGDLLANGVGAATAYVLFRHTAKRLSDTTEGSDSD